MRGVIPADEETKNWGVDMAKDELPCLIHCVLSSPCLPFTFLPPHVAPHTLPSEFAEPALFLCSVSRASIASRE